ncbi:uncharacterized protein LOC117509053 [Thalassophryne amazonica]|uniref:uncharacterized protein LOC117509053 n=1 Tax=Thalassophryne amazonica TaxID=390379 RepID=UPI00147255C1|nr:uncharacterized protein LOC117509053 [Thalassophryne amazonica]
MKTLFLISGAAVLLLCETTVCAVSILISPNLQQFLRRQSISLSCSRGGLSVDEGSVVMRTARGQTQTCGPGFGLLVGSSCKISDLLDSDTGDYWCQTGDGLKSDIISIIVTVPPFLEIPALPVVAGSNVILRCMGENGSSFPADFYKGIQKVGSGPESGFTISNVQKSDEGFFSCHVTLSGESSQSKLRVIASPHVVSGVSPQVVAAVVSLVVLVLLVLLLVGVLLLWRKQTGKKTSPPSGEITYADITINRPTKTRDDVAGL